MSYTYAQKWINVIFVWGNSKVIQRKLLAAYVQMVITWNVSLYVVITPRNWPKRWIICIVPRLSCFFPYNLITDENDFISAIADNSCVSQKSFCYLADKLLMPFELNDKDHRSALCDIDPDLHFYQEFNQATVKCNYYLEIKFNDEISKPNGKKDASSFSHVNIRSARQNLCNFGNYLNGLNHYFTVIGLSETWLNDNDSDLYGLCGYKLIGHHRGNRAGGRVTVCVQDHVCLKERPELSYLVKIVNQSSLKWKLDISNRAAMLLLV